MFALGATLYELATGLRLPNEGDRWQALREGRLVVLPAVSQQLQSLMRVSIGSSTASHAYAFNLTLLSLLRGCSLPTPPCALMQIKSLQLAIAKKRSNLQQASLLIEPEKEIFVICILLFRAIV